MFTMLIGGQLNIISFGLKTLTTILTHGEGFEKIKIRMCNPSMRSHLAKGFLTEIKTFNNTWTHMVSTALLCDRKQDGFLL